MRDKRLKRRAANPADLNRELIADRGFKENTLNSLVKLWIFRMLVPLGAMRDFVQVSYFRDDNLAEEVGLLKWLECDEDGQLEFQQKEIFKELRTMYKQLESEAQYAALPNTFIKNVDMVSRLVNLSPVDSQILTFALLLHIEPLLDVTADYLGGLSSTHTINLLSKILCLPEKEVRDALHPQGILARSGMVFLDRDGSTTMRGKLNILSSEFADCIYSSVVNPVELLRNIVTQVSPANIALSDYEHIQPELNVLLPYIKNSLNERKKGVNILLFGEPGTGKTQLTKVVAQLNQCDLFEISSEDNDGDPVEGKQRLCAYKAAQYFFASKPSLLVFDESEDIFSGGDSFFSPRSIAQTRKAWMNKILEENAVPTFWLTNSIRGMDSAFIRRFDMVIEMPMPPKKQREIIYQKQCGDIIDAATIKRYAEVENLAPAVMEKTSSIIRNIQNELTPEQRVSSLEMLVNATLKSQRHQPLPKHYPNKLPEVYDPDFIRADNDLAEVATGLAEVKSGRLCLYGPPGTGKTAYGKWLSERLELPLIVKKGSDLISMWVGGTEKNIARAFADAEREEAILLIDEVDSFLQDRRGAKNSWEITAVNEMLTQMETFPGIFIASTNLMQGLDQASLRRFDLKVKFDFLLPHQALALCLRYCTQLKIAEPDNYLKRKLECLPNLTPGDFAAVSRQNRFRPIKSAADLVMALESECAVKEQARSNGIGFLAH